MAGAAALDSIIKCDHFDDGQTLTYTYNVITIVITL